MDAIEQLIAGHRDIKEREDILRKLARMIDADAFFWDNASKISHFFDLEVSKHLDLEEKVLFPVMYRALPASKADEVRAFEKQHGMIREKLGMFSDIARYHLENPTKYTREQIVELSGQILDIVLLHSKREDELLFDFVRRYFGSRDYRDLEDRYFAYLGV